MPYKKYKQNPETGKLELVCEGEFYNFNNCEFTLGQRKGEGFKEYTTVASDKQTGKPVRITSKREHNEFLKRNDFVCIGNDVPTKPKPKEINVTGRQELSNAIDRVAEKHGIRIQA